MASVGSKGIMMLSPSLFLVAAIFVHSVGAQTCGFPSPWMYEWWRANEPGQNSRIFRKYLISSEINLRQEGTGPRVEYSIYDCQDETESAPYQYYVRRGSTDISLEDCVKGYSDHVQVTDAHLLVMSSASTGTTGFKVEDCPNSSALANAAVNIFVKYPFDFSDVACPFPTGRYLVSLNTVSEGENKCLNDRNSYSTVSADGKITFQTCESGNSYETPFQGTVLECVGDLAPTFIKSTATNGNVVIMGHKTGTDTYNFYTVRYQIASGGAVLMSVQGSTSGQLQPDPTKSFSTVGVIDNNFDYSYLMQPANCDNENINCENGGVCRDNTDGTIGFTCQCQTGFTGTYCETDIDDCPAGDCSGNGVCKDLVNDYQCTCDAGYIGKDCETRDYCSNDPCGDHGDCRNLATNFQCICDPGWTGLTCDTQQHCFSAPCQNGGICREQTNDYRCDCQAGYTGKNCETYQYCYDRPCVFGSCREGTGTYICDCQDGYAGTRCDRVLQCYNNPCKNGGECTESADGQSFTCQCPDGFSDPICGTVQRCYNHGCMNGATCVEEGNSYMCRCPPGYTGWNCGSEVHCASQPCQNGAQCIEEANTYSCRCTDGWTGYDCDTPDLCSAMPCRNGGTCLETQTGIQCNCPPGYTGQYCTLPTGCSSNPCMNGQCQNTNNGGYTCTCNPGWTGTNCQTPIGSTNCDGIVCQNDGTCQSKPNGWICACQTGYYGTFCENDRCNPNPCANEGICARQDIYQYAEGFSCECPPGYGGPLCDLVGGCNAETCDHGRCENDGGKDMCKCDEGWKGDKCDEEEGFDWMVLVIVLVILLVLVFIILAILVCVCCVMRNNGGSTEAKPKPGPVTPAGPVVREIVIPPQSVQVVDVSKQQPPPQGLIVAKPSTISTRAMFMSDNPQKVYNVNNPMETNYAVPPANPYYTRPAQAPVKYVGALQPAGGAQEAKPQDIEANVYPDIDASEYIKYGANALKGAKS